MFFFLPSALSHWFIYKLLLSQLCDRCYSTEIFLFVFRNPFFCSFVLFLSFIVQFVLFGVFFFECACRVTSSLSVSMINMTFLLLFLSIFMFAVQKTIRWKSNLCFFHVIVIYFRRELAWKSPVLFLAFRWTSVKFPPRSSTPVQFSSWKDVRMDQSEKLQNPSNSPF